MRHAQPVKVSDRQQAVQGERLLCHQRRLNAATECVTVGLAPRRKLTVLPHRQCLRYRVRNRRRIHSPSLRETRGICASP